MNDGRRLRCIVVALATVAMLLPTICLGLYGLPASLVAYFGLTACAFGILVSGLEPKDVANIPWQVILGWPIVWYFDDLGERYWR